MVNFTTLIFLVFVYKQTDRLVVNGEYRVLYYVVVTTACHVLLLIDGKEELAVI